MPVETRGKSRPGDLMSAKGPGGQEHLPEMMGTEFIFRFYRLLKGASLYDRNNATIEKLTREALQAINPFVQSQSQLYLKIVRDNFFFNSIRIPYRRSCQKVCTSFVLSHSYRRASIGSTLAARCAGR